MTNKALNRKREEQAGLQKVRTVKVCLELEATENTLQRLNALMMLSDPYRERQIELQDLGPLPWEEKYVRDGEVEENPHLIPLELDYAAIRRDIVKHFEKYTEKHGRASLEHLIQSYGGTKVSTVPDSQVLGLLADIEAAIA